MRTWRWSGDAASCALPPLQRGDALLRLAVSHEISEFRLQEFLERGIYEPVGVDPEEPHDLVQASIGWHAIPVHQHPDVLRADPKVRGQLGAGQVVEPEEAWERVAEIAA